MKPIIATRRRRRSARRKETTKNKPAGLIGGRAVIYNPASRQQPHLRAYKQTHQYLTDGQLVSCSGRVEKRCAAQEVKEMNCSQMGGLMQHPNGFTS